MRQLVDMTNSEIAWHGFVKKLHPMVYYIYDIVLYPQEVTGATVTAPEKEYAEWIDQIYESREDATHMKFHGHSHVAMGVSPSGVDMGYRNDLIRNEKDFYIFAILNKNRNIDIEIYDVKENVVYETKDIEIIVGDEEIFNSMQDKNWYKINTAKFIKEKKICPSTIQKVKNSSIQKNYKAQSTLSDVEQWEQQLQNSWYGLD